MPSQIYTPVSVSPQRKGLQVVTSTEILNSNSTTYTGTNGTVITTDLPTYAIREHDYTIPAAPPSSPVNFRNDHWLPPTLEFSTKIKNAGSPLRH